MKTRSAAEDRRVGWFAAAVILHLSRALDPLHELGHILATWAMGWGVTSVTWSGVRATQASGLTLSAGVAIELVVWGGIAIFATRSWSRLGFFASGAAFTAWLTWWVSHDRVMILEHFGPPVVSDVVFMITGVCLVLTRRHQMWLNNPQTMRLVTGRPVPPESGRKPASGPPRGAGRGFATGHRMPKTGVAA